MTDGGRGSPPTDGFADVAPGDLERLRIEPMDEADGRAVSSWSYPGIYAFYDFARAPDGGQLLDEDARLGRFFSATLPGLGLLGFVELIQAADNDDAVEIGLGLRPESTGCGLGQRFVELICEWVASRSAAATITLRVAEFNVRAITVYERAGFSAAGTELVETGGARVRFLRMTRRPAPAAKPAT